MLELCLLLEALLATSIFFLLTFVVVCFFFLRRRTRTLGLGWVEWEPRDTHHTAKSQEKNERKKQDGVGADIRIRNIIASTKCLKS